MQLTRRTGQSATIATTTTSTNNTLTVGTLVHELHSSQGVSMQKLPMTVGIVAEMLFGPLNTDAHAILAP